MTVFAKLSSYLALWPLWLLLLACSPQMYPRANEYHLMRSGLSNSFTKFQQEKIGRVAFVGGSITHNGGWRDSICQYLQTRFPDTKFDFVAAGIPSMGSTPAAFRLERDVFSKGTIDLLFEEAAVNDQTNGRTTEEQVRALEGVVRHVREVNATTDIVLMYFVDPEKMDTYRRGQVPLVIGNHERVAQHYRIPAINLAREVTDRIDAGEFSWEDDFIDLHPSPFGQSVYYQSIRAFLEQAWAQATPTRTTHSLPTPLDKENYSRGHLVDIRKAKLGKGWQLTENWQAPDGEATRANYTDVPMLTAQQSGSELTFSFTGRAVGIAVAAGPDAGIVAYSIDGNPWQQQDLFTNWSARLHLPWYYTLATNLTEDTHTLRLRLVAEKNPASTGTACRIRYFYVNEHPSPEPSYR